MRQIAAGLFISLDGVVEAPENWTGPYFNDQVGQAVGALMATNDAMLLGRVTYQGFAAAWPGMGDDDFGQRMNTIHKYVASSTLTDAEAAWGPTTVLRGDVAAEVAALKAQPGGDLLVEGSAQLVHTLAQHGLVDEYRLMIFPVILGQGKRVFPDVMPAAARLTITDSRTVGSGVLLLNLTPDRT